jgi:hypothetical protein
MNLSKFLLHGGHQEHGALGFGILPGDPVALGLIVVGLGLIVGGLYRLQTYEPPAQSVEESDA